jgi:hypothetical protein
MILRSIIIWSGEFIEFMESSGYADFNLWLDEGWSWVNINSVRATMYWHKIEGGWHITLVV